MTPDPLAALRADLAAFTHTDEWGRAYLSSDWNAFADLLIPWLRAAGVTTQAEALAAVRAADATLRSEVERIVGNGESWARYHAYPVLVAVLAAIDKVADTP